MSIAELASQAFNTKSGVTVDFTTPEGAAMLESWMSSYTGARLFLSLVACTILAFTIYFTLRYGMESWGMLSVCTKIAFIILEIILIALLIIAFLVVVEYTYNPELKFLQYLGNIVYS